MDKRYPNRSLLNLYDRRKGNIEFYIVQQLATSKSIEAIVRNKKNAFILLKRFLFNYFPLLVNSIVV